MPSLNSQLTGNETVLFTMPTSQYGNKGIVALDYAKIPYRIVEVNILKMKEQLEPPYTVPQLRYKGELLVDSSDICAKLSELPGVDFYPENQKAAVQELEAWLGSRFNCYIGYFAFHDADGFSRSVGNEGRKKLSCLCDCLLKRLLRKSADKLRDTARNVLGKNVVADGPTPGPDENNLVRKLYCEDTEKLEARFQDDSQLWLCGTEEPTAADITAYCMLERLVGDSGDVQMGGSTPWLFDKVKAPRLKAWHARMRKRFPIKFFGKDKEAKVWTEKQSALRE